MQKFYLTYSEAKNLERVQSVVEQYTDVKNYGKINKEFINKFCGTLAYACLFVLPEHKLYEGAKYTIPEICLEYPGLVSHNLYTYANSLGRLSIATGKTDAIKCLEELLGDCLLNETINYTKLTPVKVYATLAACYAYLVGDSELTKLCIETNYHTIWNYVTSNYLGGLVQ